MPTQVEAGGVPFKEAIDYLRGKLRIPTRRWDDIRGDMQAKAFVVAGANKMSLVGDLHQAVIDAREKGQSITDFRKSFDQIVQKHGWSYKGKRGWRTRTIYNMNMRQSAMAGRWKQVESTKRLRPYLQYLTVGDSRVRDEHRQWDRKVLPIDDPWWDTHYPPNGYNCRCTVRTLSDRQLQREGLGVEPTPEVERTRRVNTRTGEDFGDVPKGIDTGFDYNVGKAWLGPDIDFGKKVLALPPAMREATLSRENLLAYAQVRQKPFASWAAEVLADSKKSGGVFALGFLTHKTLNWLASKKKLVPATATITATGGEIRHAHTLRKGIRGLTSEQLLGLPVELAKVRAVLWDKRHENLTFVLDNPGGSKGSKLIVGVDVTRKGQLTNSMITGGQVQVSDLKDKNAYELIEGGL